MAKVCRPATSQRMLAKEQHSMAAVPCLLLWMAVLPIHSSETKKNEGMFLILQENESVNRA